MAETKPTIDRSKLGYIPDVIESIVGKKQPPVETVASKGINLSSQAQAVASEKVVSNTEVAVGKPAGEDEEWAGYSPAEKRRMQGQNIFHPPKRTP